MVQFEIRCTCGVATDAGGKERRLGTSSSPAGGDLAGRDCLFSMMRCIRVVRMFFRILSPSNSLGMRQAVSLNDPDRRPLLPTIFSNYIEF